MKNAFHPRLRQLLENFPNSQLVFCSILLTNAKENGNQYKLLTRIHGYLVNEVLDGDLLEASKGLNSCSDNRYQQII
jgi:hypothetical protein